MKKPIVKKNSKKLKLVKTPTKKPLKIKKLKKIPVISKKKKIEEIIDISIIDIPVVIPAIRGRKKSPGTMYFTTDTENAIDLFNKTECLDAREIIYREKIKYPFEKLVENVFNTFKFTYFETGPLDVQKETISHLVANIHKYEKEKGKAFSYFSIVAKHFLIFLNNSNYKRFNQSVEIGEDREEHTTQLQAEDKHHKESEMNEFMTLMIEYWESNIGKIFSKQRDLNIANAVVELFRNSNRIDAFNKKALYLYIREISGCKTQMITKIINKMKSHYINIRRKYSNEGIIQNVD